MADNPLIVAVLRELRDEALVTKTEAGRMLGLTRNQVAGICNRNKRAIGPWPRVSRSIQEKRYCCFPVGVPETEDFHLCGRKKVSAAGFLCAEHSHKIWSPLQR